MPTRNETTSILKKTEAYLTGALLPFWIERAPDPEFGGFLPHFDPTGKPTGETTKSLLAQIRLLCTMPCAHPWFGKRLSETFFI